MFDYYFARNIVLKMRNLPKIVLKTKIKNSPSPIDSMVELPMRRQLISSRHFRVGDYRCHNVPDCYVFLDGPHESVCSRFDGANETRCSSAQVIVILICYLEICSILRKSKHQQKNSAFSLPSVANF